ncbi:hypothetical protein HK097_006390 [Rhizophlyctis rosea]|uniref:Rhodanese domain-containing protein n=1 Tax=Rhizophlyctis rosea TaxID=64517 RepID=A0AAD5SNF8_9FUNG|nr:hypothetical protein HK097_006390 [Rhizophlyctis rosea]
MSTQPPAPEYIEPADLARLLKDPCLRLGKDLVIIDVRGDDFEHGNIAGCVNIPAQQFLDRPMAYVERFEGVPKVIFHCALSQVRGPKCATRYYSALMQGLQDMANKHEILPQQVLILRGGFDAFQRANRNDPKLLENFNQVFWDNPEF